LRDIRLLGKRFDGGLLCLEKVVSMGSQKVGLSSGDARRYLWDSFENKLGGFGRAEQIICYLCDLEISASYFSGMKLD
jgi:hypothetical protein